MVPKFAMVFVVETKHIVPTQADPAIDLVSVGHCSVPTTLQCRLVHTARHRSPWAGLWARFSFRSCLALLSEFSAGYTHANCSFSAYSLQKSPCHCSLFPTFLSLLTHYNLAFAPSMQWDLLRWSVINKFQRDFCPHVTSLRNWYLFLKIRYFHLCGYV